MEKPSKLSVFRVLLTHGSVFVHLDPSKSGVLIPYRLYAQECVVLQWGTNMPVPIPDMTADERGVGGTLSFKGVPFKVDVPWSSVYALVGDDGRGMTWDEDMPESVHKKVQAEQAEQRRKNFSVVQGGGKTRVGGNAKSRTQLRSV